jgi:hypothetical protein
MRKPNAILSMIVAVLLQGPSPALAQDDNPYGGGTRLTGHAANVEREPGALTAQDNARLTLGQFARCIIKKQRPTVMKAIQVKPWADEAQKALVAAVDEACLANGQLTIPPNLLRGAIFQELYKEKYRSGPPTLPAAPIDFTEAETAPLSGDALVDVAMLQFGDCVARRDLPNSHALVIASPGSSAETSAINALLPDFSACLVQGATWKITKSVVSTLMAEVLYRDGAAHDPAGGTGH